MSDSSGSEFYAYSYGTPVPKKPKDRYWLHILLFLATFVTCLIAGTQWANKDFTEIGNWHYGLTYTILILTFLSSHEFGHYFASKYHKVDATLPYYIPTPIPELFFGTFGAVIKTRSRMNSKKALFDIGIAGPLAGFVVSLAFLIIGLETLPPKNFIYTIHPQYLMNGGIVPDSGLHFGDTILYYFFRNIFANPHGWLPPMNEMYHYPFLCTGWFGLFVTSLNLLPIGQLDGGHIIFAMFGFKQSKISRVFWWLMVIVGSGSVLNMLYEFLQADYSNPLFMTAQNKILPFLEWLKSAVPWYFSAWGGWLFWALLTRIVIKLDHPAIIDVDEPLSPTRRFLGWAAIIIMILSFSYNGLYIM